MIINACTEEAAKLMILEIYAAYQKRINNGESERLAKDFANPSKWAGSSWCTADGEKILAELGRMGFIKKYVRNSFQLTDEGITYAENC